MLNNAVILLLVIAGVFCGKPTLSDNRGLKDERLKFDFKIKDYVFGTLWPKPQEEAKGSQLLTLDPEKFRYVCSVNKM